MLKYGGDVSGSKAVLSSILSVPRACIQGLETAAAWVSFEKSLRVEERGCERTAALKLKVGGMYLEASAPGGTGRLRGVRGIGSTAGLLGFLRSSFCSRTLPLRVLRESL